MAHRQISNFVFSLNDVLGRGSTGTVYLGHDIRNGVKVAIKVIDLKTITNQVTKYLLHNEVKALQIINHPNVLHAYEVISDNNCYYVVTNYCSNKTLEEYIKHRGRLVEEEALGIFKQIVEGYAVIRNYNILHRDLKPSNILFSEANQAVICDFGYCEIGNFMQKPKMYYNVGSPAYMAPETISKNLYSEQGEIWSLGVIFYEMIYGRNFSEGREVLDAMNQIRANRIAIPPETRLDISKRIVRECMEYNPELRIRLNDLRTLLNGNSPKPRNLALQMTQSMEYVGPNVQEDTILVSEVNKILIQNNEIKRQKPEEKPAEQKNSILVTFSPGQSNIDQFQQEEPAPIRSPQLIPQPTQEHTPQPIPESKISNMSKPEYFQEYTGPSNTNIPSFIYKNQGDPQPSLISIAELPPEMINEYIMFNIKKWKQQKPNDQEIKSDLLLLNYPLNGISQHQAEHHNYNPSIILPSPTTLSQLPMDEGKKFKESAVSNFTEKQALNSSAFLYPTGGTFALSIGANPFANLKPKEKQQPILPPSIVTQPTMFGQANNYLHQNEKYHTSYSTEKPKASSPTYPTTMGYPMQNQTFTNYMQHYPQSALPPYQPQQKGFERKY